MVEETHAPRDIHLLTIDALLADLIGGRTVALSNGEELSLASSNDARSILNWYRGNRSKWQGNLSTVDTDAIIAVIGSEPPVLEAEIAAGPAAAIKLLKLVKVEAHRFAGLHIYGRPTQPPASFIFEPGKPVTLFEGRNGSGKTSIANAIVWCLTGQLIRSQRAPEAGALDFSCEVAGEDGTITSHPMSAITPMPTRSAEIPATGQPIPIDSWVELTFADGDGSVLPPLRRSQSRTPRGKIVENPPNLSAAGIDPIAWQIATTMPALLSYLVVGSTSQLGEAVARLTGLANLVDLARHAERMSDRITKKAKPDLAAHRSSAAKQYQQAAEDLAAIVEQTPTIAFESAVPAVEADEAAERITEIADQLAELKAKALAEAQGVLGESFDPEDKKARDDLEKSIMPAVQRLKSISELDSIARLSTLSVEPAEISELVLLLDKVKAEAHILASMAATPDRARREQLYARVSAWMHDHSHIDDGTCPVCIGELKDACDPITGAPITKHLADAARDREVVARSVEQWSEFWCGHLSQVLPNSLAPEIRRDLPNSPIMLLRAGLVDELFASEPFQGALSALKADAIALINDRLAILPAFAEPSCPLLPTELAVGAANLQQMIKRIIRALAFAEWRSTNSLSLKEFLFAVRRGEEDDVNAARAIGRRLDSLLRIVEGAAPLNFAAEQTQRMKVAHADFVDQQKRVDACESAVAALGLLVPLGKLAQVQVDSLRQKLHRRTEHWRRTIYRNATTFAPDLTGTDMDARGVLELRVGREGVTAPAQHVSNASALRGALLGFFLAFREHVQKTRGGLSLLVLDDPQELLDHDNRQRLARGLAGLAAKNAQLVVTTHDRRFAQSLVAENRSEDRIQHLSVHPVNLVCPTVRLSPAIEEVDRRRAAFLNTSDDVVAAQNYASDLRVFLEARLGDLFDDITEPAHATSSRAPTLFSLVDKLRALVDSGSIELFTNSIVKQFANDRAFFEGAAARRVLNTSHHDKLSLSYMDIKEVEADFYRLRTMAEKVHEQFRLHRWREPLTEVVAANTNVVPLRPMKAPRFAVPICPDIAAFVGAYTDTGSQDTPTEVLRESWFEDKALYYIPGSTLGFAIPSGSVAIVELEPYPGRDQNLVIALSKGQILARRVAKAPGALRVSLSALMPDPRTRRPTMSFDESNVRLHRIVGAIFTTMPPPVGKGEATAIDMVAELKQVKTAYRVREDSAIPLALPGQIILGGAELMPNALDDWEGRLVAVTLNDGLSVFKRVGTRLSGSLGHLRQFETIGGLGSSLVAATEAVEDQSTAPLMASVRPILGVLYSDM